MDDGDKIQTVKERGLFLVGISAGALLSFLGNIAVTSYYRVFGNDFSYLEERLILFLSLGGFLFCVVLIIYFVFKPLVKSFSLPKWDYFQCWMFLFLVCLIVLFHLIIHGETIP